MQDEPPEGTPQRLRRALEILDLTALTPEQAECLQRALACLPGVLSDVEMGTPRARMTLGLLPLHLRELAELVMFPTGSHE